MEWNWVGYKKLLLTVKSSINWRKPKVTEKLHEVIAQNKRQEISSIEQMKWHSKEGDVIKNTSQIWQEIGSGCEEKGEMNDDVKFLELCNLAMITFF